MIESFPPQSTSSSAVEICGSTMMGSARPRPRAGQLELRGLEALMDRRSDNGDGYVEYVGSGLAADGSDQGRQQQPLSSSHKKPVLDINDQVQQQPPPPPPQQHQQRQSQQSQINTNTTWDTTPASSPRTVHPSRLLLKALLRLHDDYRNNGNMPPFSSIAPVGSPFPFSYTHVRRQVHFPHLATPTPLLALTVLVVAGEEVQVQAVLKYHISTKAFSANTLNNANFLHWGAMSESTFSPASTPFQGAFMTWVYLHTHFRAVGPKPSYKDEEVDPEDLLDLECYPSSARTMEKEVGELGGSGTGLPEPGQTNGHDYDSGHITAGLLPWCSPTPAADATKSREGNLRRALDASESLNGLDVATNIYEYRVARWNDENASREGTGHQTAPWRETSDDDDERIE
ncbi:hypothetical protein JOM56_012825 [Amanita muscaria]